MSDTTKIDKVSDNLVVSMVYELKVDGKVVDSCADDDPLQFIQGQGHIIPGLERAMDGMKIGESKHVLVKAADAYGEFDAEQIVEMPKSDFPEDFTLEPNMEVTFEDEDGSEHSAFVEEVTLDTVTFNFNHPLAGNDLEFNIRVTGLREASDEELDHGHVHMHDHDHGE